LSLKGSFTSVAIFHFDVSIVARKAGQGAIAFAAYRVAEKLLDEKTGKVYDYSRRRGVLYKEIMAPQNAPDWASDRAKLWNAVEAREKRKDSQVAREIMVALPAELDLSQQIKLVRRYIRQQFIKPGMIADFAIHAPSKQGDQRNSHGHIMLTTRTITPEGLGDKERKWNAKACIFQWRQAWEHYANQALQEAGFDCRIDGRSHASKGLDREPRLHLGHQATTLERQGEPSERGSENRAIDARNAMREQLRREYTKADGEFDGLFHDGEEQAISPAAEIQPLGNIIEDAEADKVLDAVQTQGGSSAEFFNDQHKNQVLSGKERKYALERDQKVFETWKEALHRQLENSPDEKTQDRLRLKEKLEVSGFTKAYSEGLASILAEEDPQKNAAKIVALQREARNAGKDYKKWAAEWDFRAVRDDKYAPRDAKSADKIHQIREKEKRSWADFAVKAEKNGWNPSRIEKERQSLQKRMEQQLALDVGIELSLNDANSIEM
jgi:hypothetical protein